MLVLVTFDVRFKGIPLAEFKVPPSGITYASELEWVLAAHWDNMTLEQFTQQDGAYQSHVVAAYRMTHRIEAVLAEDSRIRSERERVAQQAQQMAEGRGWK